MHHNLDNLLARLSKVKAGADGKYLACCPAHKDKTPSLAIRDVGDRILIKCFAGCSVDDICGAVGMTIADLMPAENTAYARPWEGVKGYNSRELVRGLVQESYVIMLAMRHVLRGDVLDVDDLARVNRAMIAINEIHGEVSRG